MVKKERGFLDKFGEKPQLGTKKAKLTAIGYKSSIFNGQKQFSSIYITYTLLMEAQGNLNEEALDDGQAAEVLADLNDNDMENQAPINHIDDYMRDYMMDKNKLFDDKLLDGSLTLPRRHIRCFRSRVLRNTKQMLFVNFLRVEVRSRLTLFV